MGACKLTSVTGGAGGHDGSPGYRIGTSAECPADLSSINDATACSLPSDVVCAAQSSEGGWQACTCGCEHVGQWTCTSTSGPGPACPLEQPANGSACSGFEDAGCPYFPSNTCNCNTTTHAWICGADADKTAEQWGCLSPSSPSSDPPGVDPNKTIADLNDADAHAWCTWFVTSVYTDNGAAPPPDRMVSADGTVTGYASIIGCSSSPLCIERLSIDHCVANLKLSACTATVKQLDDCVHTMVNECHAVGQGCDAYMTQTSCDQTIVRTIDPATEGDCKIPVQ
jgi:hypothetical protein